MKKNILFVALFCGIFGSFLLTTFAQGSAVKIVTANRNAIVRAEPAANAAQVGTLNTGDTAVVISEKSDGQAVSGNSLWYQVRLADKVEGWIWSGSVTTSEVTPTPIPTLVPTLAPNPNYKTITADNAKDLQLAYTWGKGFIQNIIWSPDGTRYLINSSTGLWLYDLDQHAGGQLVVPLSGNQPKPLLIYVPQAGFIDNTSNIYYVLKSSDFMTQKFSFALHIFNVANGKEGAVIPINWSDETFNNRLGYAMSRNWAANVVAVAPDGHALFIHEEGKLRAIELLYNDPHETITQVKEHDSMALPFMPDQITVSPDNHTVVLTRVNGRTTEYTFYSYPELALKFTLSRQDILATRSDGRLEVNLIFRPDGQQFVLVKGTSSKDQFEVYDANGKLLKTHQLRRQDYQAVGYVPNRDALQILFRPNDLELALHILDLTTDKLEDVMVGGGAYASAEFSPDGQRLVAWDQGIGKFTTWDLATRSIMVHDQYSPAGLSLVMDPTQRFIIRWSGSTVQYVDPNDPQGVPVNETMLARQGEPHFNPQDGSYILDMYDSLQAFDQTGKMLSQPVKFPLKPMGQGMYMKALGILGFSPDGQLVFVEHNGQLQARDAHKLTLKATYVKWYATNSTPVFQMFKDGRFFGILTNPAKHAAEAQILSSTGKPLLTLSPSVSTENYNALAPAAISENGKVVAAQSLMKSYAWDADTGKMLWQGEGIFDVAVSPDGKLLAAISINRNMGVTEMTIYDLEYGGMALTHIPIGPFNFSQFAVVAFSRDGSLLIVVDITGVTRLWGVARNGSTPHATLPATPTTLPTVQPSPTKVLAAASTAMPDASLVFQEHFEDANFAA